MAELSNINWQAVASPKFSDTEVKDGKQAEFLMFESFPWQFVEHIGVYDAAIADEVKGLLVNIDH